MRETVIDEGEGNGEKIPFAYFLLELAWDDGNSRCVAAFWADRHSSDQNLLQEERKKERKKEEKGKKEKNKE